jgi:hypothetical protein
LIGDSVFFLMILKLSAIEAALQVKASVDVP